MADKLDGIAAVAPVNSPERRGVSARPVADHQTRPTLDTQADSAHAVASRPAAARDKKEVTKTPSVDEAAKALDDHFSKLHPNVTFRVEHQALGLVVVMVDADDGTILSVIPGDEARLLAKNLSSDLSSSDFAILDKTA